MTLATALLIFFPMIPGPAPDGESYHYTVIVSRISDNLYRLDNTCDDDGCVELRTRHCEEYPRGQKAILEWSPVWDVDSLIFAGDKTCDVIG